MKNKHILVSGGAGYIGSHMVRALVSAGYMPVVVDNLSTGHRALVPKGVPFIKADLRNLTAVKKIFRQKFDAVMHFAGLIAVGESVKEPLKYYENNVVGSLNLIACAAEAKVPHFIFSSTAAVYVAGAKRLTEKGKLGPVNPYGDNKLMIERVLEDVSGKGLLRYAALRYFNACGAHSSGETGEWHEPETHLIPNVLRAARSGGAVKVFGDDYPTKDGTCIRDYIHVEDLCSGHLAALKALMKGHKSGAFNLGTGHGYSVLEVIRTAEKVTGKKIKIVMGKRRSGDAVSLVADPSRAAREFKWKAKRNLTDAVASAWAWSNYGQ
jgi:UDP-glucose 4-epimerase